MEIVEHLRKPEKYIRLGGKLPKGLMLIGPTGTGKTFLARAIAGEANVPFFYKTGSEFNEASAGEGVEKIRELFRTAKRNAPCIIFIDEIDSICSKGVSKGLHPYANTTINQILKEMDGFDNSEGIIVIGATNRPEDLDKALIRPGRFDIHVNCSIPDLSGRMEIFKHYLDKVPHRNIDIDVLAKTTTGFSAADISNVVNQAALKAATEDCHYVLQKHLEDASDRVIMGPARIKGKLPDKESNRITAYHEAGHTLVALYTPYATPLHKVTIIPRQKSLGNTSFMSEKDKYHATKAEILARIDVLMGGRAAEELIFGKDLITTGASDDLEKATLLAYEFIMEFGTSGDITLRRYESDILNILQILNPYLLSPQAIEKTNIEIDKIMNQSYARAKSILTKKAVEHKRLAEALLEYGTLTAKEVQSVIEGKPLKKESTENLSGVEKKRKTQ
uniref:AAA domain-containing protein n=1 Tax=Strongyloides papillosus TaxID=174720 RepID=A0A0N5BT93_STREA